MAQDCILFLARTSALLETSVGPLAKKRPGDLPQSSIVAQINSLLNEAHQASPDAGVDKLPRLSKESRAHEASGLLAQLKALLSRSGPSPVREFLEKLQEGPTALAQWRFAGHGML